MPTKPARGPARGALQTGEADPPHLNLLRQLREVLAARVQPPLALSKVVRQVAGTTSSRNDHRRPPPLLPTAGGGGGSEPH